MITLTDAQVNQLIDALRTLPATESFWSKRGEAIDLLNAAYATHPTSVEPPSLRDHFAGQALTAMNLHHTPAEMVANLAYRIADQMMITRSKK